MHTLDELKFAQRYPFSETAQRIRRGSDVALSELPDELVERACSIISSVAAGAKQGPGIKASSELLLQEVLSFPVVKLLLSAISDEELYRRFARMVASSAFESMQDETDEALAELASSLGVASVGSSRKPYFAEIKLFDYLSHNSATESMRLLHQPVAAGIVHLIRHDFIRLISESACTTILLSLPVERSKIPKGISLAASRLRPQLLKAAQHSFASLGAAAPEKFPPCIAELCSSLSAGRHLGHNDRFVLAAFLAAVGMTVPQIVELFKGTPNFSRKITEYQVSRIAGARGQQRYSPLSCIRMRSAGLCKAECGVKHPLQQYRRGLSTGGKRVSLPKRSSQ